MEDLLIDGTIHLGKIERNFGITQEIE